MIYLFPLLFQGSEDIEAIYLDSSVLSFDVNAEAFKNMYNLRYLKIFSSDRGNHHALHLPKGVKTLPDELRLLLWEYFPLLSLPQDFNSGNLVILSMCNSKLQKLWKGTKVRNIPYTFDIPFTIGALFLFTKQFFYSRNLRC